MTPNSTIMRRTAMTLVLLLSGCTVGPNYEEPADNTPGSWGELGAGGAATQPATDAATAPATQPGIVTADPAQLAQWWTTLGDATLDRLVLEAVRGNPDLRRAQARVREARAERGVARSQLFPQVTANGSYEHSSSSKNLAFASGIDQDLYQAGFDAAWEIDVFGGVRRNVEAADADVAAAVEDRRDVLVSLLAEVARNYIELRGAQREMQIARENLASQRETLDIIGERLAAGLATDLDAARAEAQFQATASQVPTFETSIRQSIHLLGVLLGREPMALSIDLSKAGDIPRVPALVGAGLPSELLRRRPDIRRAERQLAAQTARVGVATADLYPKFYLTGSAGLQSISASSFFSSGSKYWSIGPSIVWPVFTAGRIRANIQVQDARTEQLAAAYESVVLGSLREVEDAMVAYAQEQSRRERLASAVAANVRAVELSRLLYKEGRTDFLSVLDAQRALYLSQDALVKSEQTVSQNLVALYKALGGGWEVEGRADREQADR